MESMLSIADIAKSVERTFVSHLQEDEDYNFVFIVGDVVFIHPHYGGDPDDPDTARIKMTLREPETGEQFAALIFGHVSYSVSCNVNLNSRLALSGFRTEPNRGLDASLLLILSRASHCRIWQVTKHEVSADNSWAKMFSSGRRTHDFYAVVRSLNNVNKKSKSVAIDVTGPPGTSLTCRVKNCHAKMTVFPAEPGDVLRVRGASFLLYSKMPTVVVTCANVAVFKHNSLAAGEKVYAFSPGSGAKLDIQDKAEIDAVVRLFTWNGLRHRKLRELEAVNTAKREIDQLESRPPHRLSSIAVLHTVDVFCVVVAVHRVTTPREHVCLTVCDGTVPGFVTPSRPATPPAGAEVIRRDDAAWRLFEPSLVSVSVLRSPWSDIAAALPLGAHVRLNGLTVRRDKRRNRYWVVFDSRSSKQGLHMLSKPCLELSQFMKVLGDDTRERADTTKRAETFSESRKMCNALQEQQNQLNEAFYLESGSEGELFSSCESSDSAMETLF